MSVRVILPDDGALAGARTVVRVLRGARHEAWVVGGAVRDLVRGLLPREYDIATSARPEEVMALFRRTVPVGVQFGVVRVRVRGREYEVATFRAEEGYSDGRRPDTVRFTDLSEDVSRRDFTMNGLAMDPFSGEVIDIVGGVADIEAGVIRAIGDPVRRFSEDRLRPLRAVRLAAQTGFAIEAETYRAIQEAAPDVARVSAERVRDEVSKTLESPRPGDGLRLLASTGLLPVVLPEVDQDLVSRTAEALDRAAGAGETVMWAVLLFGTGKDGAGRALDRLRQPGRLRRAVEDALEVAAGVRHLPLSDVAAEKRLLRSDGVAAGLAALDAWLAAGGEDRAPVRAARDRLDAWSREDLFPPRLLSGDEVIEAGIARGPEVSKVLLAIEDEQLRGRLHSREEALSLVRARADRRG